MYMFIAYSTVLVHCNRVVCLHFIFQCIMYYIIKNIFHHSLWELLCGLKIPATAFNKAQLLLPLFTFIIVFFYLLLLFVIVICYCYLLLLFVIVIVMQSSVGLQQLVLKHLLAFI